MQKATLTMRAAGNLHRQLELLPTDPVNRYKVESVDHDVFIIGLLCGNGHERWKIAGRKGTHKTPDEALAVLQKEADEA